MSDTAHVAHQDMSKIKSVHSNIIHGLLVQTGSWYFGVPVRGNPPINLLNVGNQPTIAQNTNFDN